MAFSGRSNQEAPLRIQLLGGFRVWVKGVELPAERWRLRKARALVKLLALAPGHCLHREQLMEALWPEQEPAAAANNLHQAIYAARRALDSGRDLPKHFLLFEDEMLSLQPEASLWVDVDAFERAAREARSTQDAEAYQAALARYTGDLLPEDLYEDWAASRRETLRQEHLALLLGLAGLYETQGEYSQAIEAYQKTLEQDPAHEAAHTGLMRAYALSGQRQAALRQYQTLQEALQEELAADPAPESQRLYEEILAGELAPADVPLSFPKRPTPRHNLPGQLTSFIGREQELAAVKNQLGETRLLTLTGVGGTGKTRLALQVAAELLEAFEHGVWLVELAPLSDPARVASTVAALFGLREEGGQPLEETLQNYLQNRHLLLILDNCEHLIDAIARFAKALLQTATRVKILATSREALGLAGETVYLVPPMDTPDVSQLPPLESLTQYDAVQLFLERARGAQPAFGMTVANAPRVGQICSRLDGLPLAIELAASRMRLLSVEQIASRLDDRFRLLTGGSRTALPHQQTLRATIDWSYQLLTEPEQVLLRQLSVFVGGWTLEAAEGVCACGSQGEFEVLDGLASLVNKSLVEVQVNAGVANRYRMLETVRQYAQAKLVEAGEDEQARNRYLAYYATFAEAMDRKLHTPDYHTGLAQLDAEGDNIRASLDWGLKARERSQAEDWLRLATALGWYWCIREHEPEGYEWMVRGLQRLSEEIEPDVLLRARACYWTALLGRATSDVPMQACLQFGHDSVSLYRQTDDRLGLALALSWYGGVLADTSPGMPYPRDFVTGLTLLEEGIAICKELGDPWALGLAYGTEAFIALQRQEYGSYLTLNEKSISCYEQAGDLLGSAIEKEYRAFTALNYGDYGTAQEHALDLLAFFRSQGFLYEAMLYVCGLVAYYQNDFNSTERYYQEVYSLSTERGYYINSITFSTRMLGMCALLQGQFERARQLFLESYAHGCKMKSGDRYGDPGGELAFVLWVGILAERLGQPLRAARFLGTVEAVLETFFKPLDVWDKMEYERLIEKVRTQLDPASLAAAWEAGRALNLEQVLAEALAFCREP